MNQEVPAEERFHTNIVGFGNLAFQLISDANAAGFKTINPKLVELACTIINRYNNIEIIDNFIYFSHPSEIKQYELTKNGGAQATITLNALSMENHWDKIYVRNENYFIEHANKIFSKLPMNNVNLFKDLFELKDSNGNQVINENDRNLIWDYFDSFVNISIKYAIKNPNRFPTLSKEYIQIQAKKWDEKMKEKRKKEEEKRKGNKN